MTSKKICIYCSEEITGQCNCPSAISVAAGKPVVHSTSDLCADCQTKMPLMDFDKAVIVIQYIILLDKNKDKLPKGTIIEEIEQIAGMAHAAIYSTREV